MQHSQSVNVAAAMLVSGQQVLIATSKEPLLEKTALVGLSHQGPLRVQKLFHDADLAYLVMFCTHLVAWFQVIVCSRDSGCTKGAKVLITTPASGKLYKARKNEMLQTASTNIRGNARRFLRSFASGYDSL